MRGLRKFACKVWVEWALLISMRSVRPRGNILFRALKKGKVQWWSIYHNYTSDLLKKLKIGRSWLWAWGAGRKGALVGVVPHDRAIEACGKLAKKFLFEIGNCYKFAFYFLWRVQIWRGLCAAVGHLVWHDIWLAGDSTDLMSSRFAELQWHCFLSSNKL